VDIFARRAQGGQPKRYGNHQKACP
jgi:hypothetical protein